MVGRDEQWPVGPALTAWTLLDAPGEFRAASYLAGPNAKQYRLIVDTIADNQALWLAGVSLDDLERAVRSRLVRDADALWGDLNLTARLDQLVEWGTCIAWQDKAETEAEFLRNRQRYQLSAAGSAINQAARAIEADEGPTSTAVLLAPVVLLGQLREILDAVASERFDDASAKVAAMEHTLDAMLREASGWQARLAAALGGAPTEARITRLLDTVLSYVDAWGAGIDAWSTQIVDLLPGLRAIPDETWRAVTLVRLGGSAPEGQVVQAQADIMRIVPTLETWFAGEVPQAGRLRRQMRNAVAPVLRGHRTLLAVGGTVSRSAELLRLADAIAAAPTDNDAWRLWATGTGLYSARHFGLATPEVSGALSAWDAPPAPISKRLRAQGSRSLTGRAASVKDTSAARLRARQAAARTKADLAAAERSLVARGGTSFHDWTPLSAAEADLLLGLVSSARANRVGEGVTPDGRWTMTMTPTDPPRSAVLTTPAGRIVLADAYVEFRR